MNTVAPSYITKAVVYNFISEISSCQPTILLIFTCVFCLQTIDYSDMYSFHTQHASDIGKNKTLI